MDNCLHLQLIEIVQGSGEFEKRTLRCRDCRCRLELDEQGIYQAQFVFDFALNWQAAFTQLNTDIFQAMAIPAKLFRFHAGGDK